MLRRLLLCTTLLTATVAGPAGAVVGGKAVRPSAVPWVAGLSGCGGTLVAPDRVLTAAHCVEGADLGQLGTVRLGAVARRPIRVALHPEWPERNGRAPVQDVALLLLDRPVTGVRPAALPRAGARTPRRLTIYGRGATSASQGIGDGVLRRATLRPLTDRQCAPRWRARRGNDDEQFFARAMRCAIDVDGRRPLSSGCVGDSGGPLAGGSARRPVLWGVVSWGGDGCGADRLPTVFADVAQLRGFVTMPQPVWAPVAGGPVRAAGDARPGGTLTCETAPWAVAPDELVVTWVRLADGRTTELARGLAYAVRPEDAGRTIGCVVVARNAGGTTTPPPSPDAFVRIAS